MDILTRLTLRYKNPVLLGLDNQQDLNDLLEQLAQAGSYEAALLPLLELELSALRQKAEELKSASGATIVQGLATRLASLEREYLRLNRKLSGSSFQVVSGGTVTWIPDPRQQLLAREGVPGDDGYLDA